MTSTAKTPSASGGQAAPDHLGHVIFITAAAALGGFLFGYDSSVINGANSGIQGKFDLSSGSLGTVAAIALLGCAVGAMIAGKVADRIGRIRVMQIAATLFTISAIGSGLPFSVWDLGFWRILGGIAIGMASVVGPAYIAEVAPPAYRGRLTSFQQAAIVIGIATSQLVNYAILRAGGGERDKLMGLETWQWMLIVMVIPSVIYGLMSFLIPESPRFLIQAGRVDEAKKILGEIEPNSDLDARVAEIDADMRSEHKSTFKDLRSGKGGLLPIVWIGIGLSVFQQLVGINVIFYFSNILWQSVGIDPSSSFFYSFETSIVNIIGTVIAMLFVDRIGRKPLALIGSVGMGITLAVMAVAFGQQSTAGATLPHSWGVIALVAANLFVLFFALSWGVVVWVWLAEIFPSRIRSAALGVAVMAQWLANFAITKTFPSMSDWNLSLTYVMYAAFAFLSIAFIAKFVPETKGKKLEDMS